MQILSKEEFLKGFKEKNRTILSKAITLIESEKEEHQILAQEILQELLAQTGKSWRVGISGTPGVGKSTFINKFGQFLLNHKKTVAVLAVDPTSQVSGGSILGDKTRMGELAANENVFIRPSPSGKNLGGVAKRTREVMLLLEAFGFDTILVETVGVGQSETKVAEMVDYFMMLLQPGAGDDLQGIKRGILEVVDMVVVTKDDGENRELIKRAKHDYHEALHILHSGEKVPPVLSSSAITGYGMEDVFKELEKFFKEQNQTIVKRRKEQQVMWFHQMVQESLFHWFEKKVPPKEWKVLEEKLRQDEMTPTQALSKLKKFFP